LYYYISSLLGTLIRDYGLEPLVWDAESHISMEIYRGMMSWTANSCEHEWGDTMLPAGQSGWHTFKRKHHNPGCHKTTIGAPMKKTNLNQNKGHGNFCTLCGAWRGSLGLEPTFQLYIQHLMQIFDEVKRVLKKTGTCWVNIGDSYNANYRGGGADNASNTQLGNKGTIDFMGKQAPDRCGLPAKSLCQIPSRFALAMTDAGWILRNELIWFKRNCMPSSAKDRFTVDFEKVFFFTKQRKYWFEQQFDSSLDPEGDVRRLMKAKDYSSDRQGGNSAFTQENRDEDKTRERMLQGRNKRCVWKDESIDIDELLLFISQRVGDIAPGVWEQIGKEYGLKKSVWDITTQPYPEAHFATFPEELVETPILAGCPEHGIVLDPFMGSGTVAKVALRANRQFIGFEPNQEYIDMANKRIEFEMKQRKLDL